jgi:hypothetical protein
MPTIGPTDAAALRTLILSQPDDSSTRVQVDCKGAALIEIRVGGTANGNALYAWV